MKHDVLFALTVGLLNVGVVAGCGTDPSSPSRGAGSGTGLSVAGGAGVGGSAGTAGAASGGGGTAVAGGGSGGSTGGAGGLTGTGGGAGLGAGGTAGAGSNAGGAGGSAAGLRHVIIDSDANNEMDDQHAIAYALFNADEWHIDGITTNATSSGGPAPAHTKEAQRVVDLCASAGSVSVYTGATDGYTQIKGALGNASFDGKAAVDFIIARAALHSAQDKLILMPIGKLTNIALAFDKDPSITAKVRVFWLGSNWPNAGEYNLENDPDAARRVVDSDVELDIATVRYDGKPEPGTAQVTLTLDELKAGMLGRGPVVAPVEGRNGGTFTRFGDYSVDLMSHIGNVRALYDMAAVAALKHPAWATPQDMPAPSLNGTSWSNRPNNARKVRFWHSFNRDAIVADLFAVTANPHIQQ